MKSNIISWIVLVYVSLYMTGCGGTEIQSKSMEQFHTENGVPVRLTIVTAGKMTREVTYHSVLTGIQESSASSMVNDRVKKIHYSVGDQVPENSVVVSFPTDNPSAQYFQAKVNVEHALTTLARMEDLYKNGGISLQELDDVRTRTRVAEANWEAVHMSVEVEAPISGVLSSLEVSESDNVESGDILFTITRTEKLKTRLWVSEDLAASLYSGTKAIARWKDARLPGRVIQVDRSLKIEKQAFGVVIEFDNDEGNVISGIIAEITLFIEAGDKTILVERKDLVKEGKELFVFTAEDSLAIKKPVVLGRSAGIKVEIIEGLTAGEYLITEGQMLLNNGKKIRVINGL